MSTVPYHIEAHERQRVALDGMPPSRAHKQRHAQREVHHRQREESGERGLGGREGRRVGLSVFVHVMARSSVLSVHLQKSAALALLASRRVASRSR